MSVKCNNEVDVPSPVMLVLAIGNDDGDVDWVAMDNVTSVLSHVDAHEERADRVIGPPLPLLNAIELLVGRTIAHVTDTA